MRPVYRAVITYGPRKAKAKAAFIFESKAELEALMANCIDLSIWDVAFSVDHLLTAQDAAREIKQRSASLSKMEGRNDD